MAAVLSLSSTGLGSRPHPERARAARPEGVLIEPPFLLQAASLGADCAGAGLRSTALGREPITGSARTNVRMSGSVVKADLVLIDRALALNPNLEQAWSMGGWIRNYLGDTEGAIGHFMKAIRQSRRDPRIVGSYHGMAHAYFCSGDYDEASAWAEKAIAEAPNYTLPLSDPQAGFTSAARPEHVVLPAAIRTLPSDRI